LDARSSAGGLIALAVALSQSACFLSHGDGPSSPLCEPAPGVIVTYETSPAACQCPEWDSSALPVVEGDPMRVCPGIPAGASPFGCGSQRCTDGLVCLDMSASSTCVAPAACKFIRDYREESSEPWTCVYADLTNVDAGLLADVDCTPARQDSAVCGQGCGCTASTSRCYGMSEASPMGACVPVDSHGRTASCHEGSAVLPDPACGRLDDPVCLLPATEPAWADAAFWAEESRRAGLAVFTGVCAERTACRVLADLYPDC